MQQASLKYFSNQDPDQASMELSLQSSVSL